MSWFQTAVSVYRTEPTEIYYQVGNFIKYLHEIQAPHCSGVVIWLGAQESQSREVGFEKSLGANAVTSPPGHKPWGLGHGWEGVLGPGGRKEERNT